MAHFQRVQQRFVPFPAYFILNTKKFIKQSRNVEQNNEYIQDIVLV
jgi:hypothetical protein